MIKIIGLGPGSVESLTLGALDALQSGAKIYLRTDKHPVVDYLKEKGFVFDTFDSAYENSDSFDKIYDYIAKSIIKVHSEVNNIVYAVPGHPLVAEKSVTLLIKYCEEQHIEFEIITAVSFIDVIVERLKIDPINGLQLVDAFDIHKQVFNKRLNLIITQVYNKFIASEVKLSLSQYYKDDTEIFFVRAAGIKGLECIRKIRLFEIDRQEDIDYLTSIFIPMDEKNNYDFNDLLEIMDKLKGNDGCPWDREQTHESLKRYLLEESYEVIEAIDENDEDMLTEELGDVLFQVIFHAAIGKAEGYFDISDVINGICEKMIVRHPHVFGEIKANTSGEVLDNWDKIKKEEKGHSTVTEEIKHIAKILPGLMRAEKVQRKAAKVGFDWNSTEEAFEKVLEELEEVRVEYKGENLLRIQEEIGDLLFSIVNVARFLNIDSELAITKTTEKFIKRFEFIEQNALSRNLKFEELSFDEMNLLWEEAKNK